MNKETFGELLERKIKEDQEEERRKKYERQIKLLIAANLILIIAVIAYFTINLLQTNQVIEYMRMGNELMEKLR